MPRFISIWALLTAGLMVGLTACQPRNRASERLARDSAAVQQIDTNLTFNNITLDQADEQGKTVWRITAKQATYSEDKQIARLTLPEGELYQDGKAAYQVKAQSGEILQNGEKIFLRGDIEAVDLESKAVLKAQELEWIPNRSLLILRKDLTGTHPQIQIAADQAQIFNKERRMELSGQVTATTTDPVLQLKAERLVWLMQREQVVSDRPLQVTRFLNQQVSDVAQGNQGNLNLQTNVLTLTNSARIVTSDPPLQISSNSLVWNVPQEVLNTDQPVTVIQRQEQVTLAANAGRFNLGPQTATLTGNVRAVGQRNQAQLNANRLDWNIRSREVVAEGDVDYRQTDPPVTMRGPRAVGKLERQTVTVSGGRVVTEIIPEGL
ncbi:LPS export ABC transporter periplasmic protein LptC [Thermoleptolyngbya sp. M55_K2018_002]|uniref:LPS export ABC transporter periplasmic protein LptC n=1 Tax=Thermoleptolyngbya sp. M55_K2018_002 TaxID=2747808 RepID=UPI001A0570CE|nr:LPS export ABC transporter periplasmic protein LptC [Thermoleptolyngbya sp. M55_K2018_002]HIK41107.1 LPS export ABC transporter periplasmic protein LptC [Thermoleptolyngbya sp. M55_K2018_002]